MKIVGKDGRPVPFGQLERAAERVMREEMADTGRKIVKDYFIPRSRKDTGAYNRGHRVKVTGTGFNVQFSFTNATKYHPYPDTGRKRGGVPPVLNAILPWVRRKGLGQDNYPIHRRRAYSNRSFRILSNEDYVLRRQIYIAWRIALKIAAYGTKGPHPNLYKNVLEANSGMIQRMKQRVRERLIDEFST